MTPPPLLEVDGLDLAYRQGGGWLEVLHDVSLRIDAGERLGLVGESGCGKSTLAYQLLGYRHPMARVTGGEVRFKGESLLSLERPARDALRGNRIARVPQDPTTALSPGMRVGRQIAEVLAIHGRCATREEAEGRVAELFASVRLPDPEEALHRYPHQLSGGQQQRVLIAMALACNPDLVVLDEPTTGLDVTTQEQILGLLLDLRARSSTAMLYVSHDLGVIGEIADRVGVMYAGHMVETAPSAELFAEPFHPYTRGLIGSIPRMSAGGGGEDALEGLLRREELPPGCPFYPRCDHAAPSCASNAQRLEGAGGARRVACERWREIPKARRRPARAPDAPRRAAEGEVLAVEGVSLGYGHRGGGFGRRAPRRNVVHDCSFSISRGETFALVGESGSGKSTIARAIAGLLPPVAGRIRFRGEAVPALVEDRSPSTRRDIQYVFQNPDASLNPRRRVGAILSRPLEMFFDLDRTGVRRRVAEALHDVRLEGGYAGRFPDQLSGGERQRIAIARALVAEPSLMLCDEVLSALDVSVQASMLALLRRLRRERDIAMLFISHDLAVVRSLADRAAVLFHGHLFEVGAIEQIFTPPFHPYTHSLLMAVPGTGRVHRDRGARADPGGTTASGRPGCPFADRCPWKMGSVCDEERPPWRETEGGLRIRCHLPLEALSARAEWRSDEGRPAADGRASTPAARGAGSAGRRHDME